MTFVYFTLSPLQGKRAAYLSPRPVVNPANPRTWTYLFQSSKLNVDYFCSLAMHWPRVATEDLLTTSLSVRIRCRFRYLVSLFFFLVWSAEIKWPCEQIFKCVVCLQTQYNGMAATNLQMQIKEWPHIMEMWPTHHCSTMTDWFDWVEMDVCAVGSS